MPGACQNLRSAPQKQPIPNIAISSPAGNGGWMRLPLTKCLAGTLKLGAARPGSARSAVGISVFLRRICHMVRLRLISSCANMAIEYRRIEGRSSDACLLRLCRLARAAGRRPDGECRHHAWTQEDQPGRRWRPRDDRGNPCAREFDRVRPALPPADLRGERLLRLLDHG